MTQKKKLKKALYYNKKKKKKKETVALFISLTKPIIIQFKNILNGY